MRIIGGDPNGDQNRNSSCLAVGSKPFAPCFLRVIAIRDTLEYSRFPVGFPQYGADSGFVAPPIDPALTMARLAAGNPETVRVR